MTPTNSPAPKEVDLDEVAALLEKVVRLTAEMASVPADQSRRIEEYRRDIDGFKALALARIPALIAHIRTLEAKLSESEAATKLAGAVSVNADLICAVIKEEGDVPAEYLAVKIANTLDPPNTPNWDAAQVVRLYSALRTVEGQTLTHTAQRSIDMIVAAKATAAEEATKAEKERCAKIADTTDNPLVDIIVKDGDRDLKAGARFLVAHEDWNEARKTIASAIRSSSSSEEKKG